MKLRPLTQEELREELYQTLLDLCGDVLLLDCLLFPEETENRPDLWASQSVRAAACRRLADYIEQHTRDIAVVSGAFTARS